MTATRLIVEALSPSNKGLAWQRKVDAYFRLQGVAHLLLIDSEEVQATLHTRTAAEWEPTDADDLEQVLETPAIGCRLAVRDVFEGWKFEAVQGSASIDRAVGHEIAL